MAATCDARPQVSQAEVGRTDRGSVQRRGRQAEAEHCAAYPITPGMYNYVWLLWMMSCGGKRNLYFHFLEVILPHMNLSPRRLSEALELLGAVLADRDLYFEVVVVGGAAMALNRVAVRPTQDVDAIAVSDDPGGRAKMVHELPESLADAVRDVADVMNLEEDWLNAGVGAFVPPLEIEDVLPDAASHLYGKGALRVTIANKVNLAKLKLYAAVDEGQGSAHETDLRRLDLTPRESSMVVTWYRHRFAGREDIGLEGTITRVWGDTYES